MASLSTNQYQIARHTDDHDMHCTRLQTEVLFQSVWLHYTTIQYCSFALHAMIESLSPLCLEHEAQLSFHYPSNDLRMQGLIVQVQLQP